MSKLTLSIDSEIIATAKDLATQQQTSVSEMFSNLIKAMSERDQRSPRLSPIAKQASGMLNIKPDFNYKDILADALVEKYKYGK